MDIKIFAAEPERRGKADTTFSGMKAYGMVSLSLWSSLEANSGHPEAARPGRRPGAAIASSSE
jgi:hypothetical protein